MRIIVPIIALLALAGAARPASAFVVAIWHPDPGGGGGGFSYGGDDLPATDNGIDFSIGGNSGAPYYTDAYSLGSYVRFSKNTSFAPGAIQGFARPRVDLTDLAGITYLFTAWTSSGAGTAQITSPVGLLPGLFTLTTTPTTFSAQLPASLDYNPSVQLITQFDSSVPGAQIFARDFTIEAVPEPANAAALAFGLLLFVAKSRDLLRPRRLPHHS